MLIRRLVLAVAALVARPARAEAWRRYRDPYVGTRIDYPDRFRPDPSHEQANGARFVSGDGAAFLVHGRLNAEGRSLAELQSLALESLGPDDRVTYRAQGRSWFVISGFEGGQILYEKHVLSGGGRFVHIFVITYPESQRRAYDVLVTRMSRSFGSEAVTPG